jgi:hypothetical protein
MAFFRYDEPFEKFDDQVARLLSSYHEAVSREILLETDGIAQPDLVLIQRELLQRLNAGLKRTGLADPVKMRSRSLGVALPSTSSERLGNRFPSFKRLAVLFVGCLNKLGLHWFPMPKQVTQSPVDHSREQSE